MCSSLKGDNLVLFAATLGMRWKDNVVPPIRTQEYQKDKVILLQGCLYVVKYIKYSTGWLYCIICGGLRGHIVTGVWMSSCCHIRQACIRGHWELMVHRSSVNSISFTKKERNHMLSVGPNRVSQRTNNQCSGVYIKPVVCSDCQLLLYALKALKTHTQPHAALWKS